MFCVQILLILASLNHIFLGFCSKCITKSKPKDFLRANIGAVLSPNLDSILINGGNKKQFSTKEIVKFNINTSHFNDSNINNDYISTSVIFNNTSSNIISLLHHT